MKIFSRFCCCCSLSCGGFFIGLIEMIIAFLTFGIVGLMFGEKHKIIEIIDEHAPEIAEYKVEPLLSAAAAILAALTCMQLVSAVLLIMGIKFEHYILMVPWILYNSLAIFMLIIASTFHMLSNNFDLALIVIGVEILIRLYAAAVIQSLYDEIYEYYHDSGLSNSDQCYC